MFYGEEDYMKLTLLRMVQDAVCPADDPMATFNSLRLDGLDLTAARLLEHGILAKWPEAPVRIVPCSGLCSFYAQDQGIIITY